MIICFISADLPTDIFKKEQDKLEENDEKEEEEYLVDPDRFLILSEYGLDPLKPISSGTYIFVSDIY